MKIKKFLYKLDPRTKIITTILLIISLFLITSFTGYFFIVIFLLVILFLNGISIMKILKKSKIYIYMGLITGLFNIFFIKTGNVLLNLKIFKIYDKPIIYMLQIIVQLILLTIIVEIFMETTKTSEIMKGINYLFNKKNQNTKFSLMCITSIQFINIINMEMEKIIKSQKSRGTNFTKINIKNIKELLLIIIPLFQITLKKVDKITEIMEIKNFILGKNKSEFIKLKFSKGDFIYFFIVSLFIKILFFLIKVFSF